MSYFLPGGYGFAPGYSPPYGADEDAERVYTDSAARSSGTRRLLDFADKPSTLWGSLLKSGYREVYGLTIEGIPFAFGQREMWTTRGVAAGISDADNIAISYGLVIDPGERTSQEANRAEGLASGRALTFIIGRQQIADEGLGPLLFMRPTLRATLTEAVTDPAQDWFNVDDNAAWDSSGFFYIGRECVKYTSQSDTSFGGCQRGIAGEPHYHTASTNSAYRQCTDVPVYWRGRLVTLWAHLVGPDGRFLGDRWCELGEWCRQEWRGFVRDPPRPEQAGMALTCLPLPRLLAQEFGAEVRGKMRADWIVSEPQDTVTIDWVGHAASYPTAPITTNNSIIPLLAWTGIIGAQVTAAGDGPLVVAIEDNFRGLWFRFRSTSGTTAHVWPQAWFLEGGEHVGSDATANTPSVAFVPFSWHNGGAGTGGGSWIVVELDPNVDFADAVIGDEGLIALDVGDHTEIASYDRYKTTNDGTKIAFRLKARDLLGTSSTGSGGHYWNPWENDTTVRVIAGAQGLWEECLRTLLTSSGTGARGDFDTLPYGFGLGLPDDWIAPGASVYGLVAQIPHQAITAVTAGKTSASDLLCGWLALIGGCVVMRRLDDGRMVLDVVPTFATDDPDAEEMGASDVSLDGHDTPEMLDAPNHVKVTTSDLLSERPTTVVRDAARAQAEGVHSLEVKAPGASTEIALRFGGELIILSDGQEAVRVQLPPWFEGQIGDTRNNTSAHPAIYDWGAGSYAPASILGRIVEHEKSLHDGSQSTTLIFGGQAQARTLLCPCAFVLETDAAGLIFRVAKGDTLGFTVGDTVLVYETGNEDANNAEANIDAITIGDEYDSITLDGTTVTGTDLVITFPVYGDSTARQQRFMFVVADKAWR